MKKIILVLCFMFLLSSCNPSSKSIVSPEKETYYKTTNSPTTYKLFSTQSSQTPITQTPFATTTKIISRKGVRLAKLINSQQGWVVTGNDLYWTDDIGAHWEHLNIHLSQTDYIANVYFLDSQHGWMLILGEGDSADTQVELAEVAYTVNGGKLWEIKKIDNLSGTGDGNLFFLDNQRGWLTVDSTQSMNSSQANIYQTMDGGKTWQFLGISPNGEFRFTSPSNGWMVARCCTNGGNLQLFNTLYSGRTWTLQLPQLGDTSDDFYLPYFFGYHEGVLPARIYDDQLGINNLMFYLTYDNGETWKWRSELKDQGNLVDVQLYNNVTWVVLAADKGIYWTINGGVNWMENINEDTTQLLFLSIGSPTTAWGLECDSTISNKAPDCLILVSTSDMGAHWNQLFVQS